MTHVGLALVAAGLAIAPGAARAELELPPPGSSTTAAGIRLLLAGYVQADAVVVDQSSVDEVNPATGDVLNDNRFLIRRARLRAEGQYGVAGAALEIDANTVRGPTLRLLAAEGSLRWPGEEALPLLKATIGQFKIPFGFEVQEKVERRLFFEPSYATRGLFAGDYDLGIKLESAWSFLRAQAAIMNGEPIGERSLPVRDPNAAKDVLGRLGIDTAIVEGVAIEAGLSALVGKGFHKGTPSTKDSIVWRDFNENGIVELSELQPVSGTAATPSENFDRSAIGGDLRVRVEIPELGELTVFGELVWAVNLDRALEIADPISAGRDQRELGVVAGFTQEITEYFMLGLRFDRYDPDADASDPIGAEIVPLDAAYGAIAVVAAFRYGALARLSVEYDHNQNPLGRAADGAVTTLADDTLTLRLQVAL